jgi:hypothetical protein
MSFKNLQKFVGIVLTVIGGIGGLIGVYAIFDPIGTKFADYVDPFRVSTSIKSSIIMSGIYFSVAMAGIWLVRNGYKGNDTEN